MTDITNRDTCTSLNVVTWNVNSWTPANEEPRLKCITSLNPDIIFLIETKLKQDQVLTLEGYVWHGLNRKNQLKTAKCGSGGVGIFVRKTLLSEWHFDEIDTSIDGLYFASLL